MLCSLTQLDLSHCNRAGDAAAGAIGHRAGAHSLRDLSLHGLFLLTDRVRSAWRGVAWCGVAWRGVAWRGVAWRGVALHALHCCDLLRLAAA